MMVNNHWAWIRWLVVFPRGLVFCFCCAVSMASAQGKTAMVASPATAQASRNLVSGGAASAPSATAQKPTEATDDLMAELKELRDVQTGLFLTLAACGDEPHCVSGVNQQEMARMQERLRKVTQQLEQDESEARETTRQALRTLQEEADKLQASVAKVEAEIDATKLEGSWSDQFVFDDFNAAPAVPFPNEKVPLVRFEDAELPLPLE